MKLELLEGRYHTPDRDVLAAWIASAGNRIRAIETVTGGLVENALEILARLPAEDRQCYHRKIKVRDAGETAIRDTLDRDSTGLVLFEDRHVTRMDFGPHVRVMSGRAFATALEALGVMPLADELFTRIELAGRSPSRAFYDWRPGDVSDDLATSYDTAPVAADPDTELPSSPSMGM